MSSDSLKIYYETIYPEVCIPDSRFLASKEGLVIYSRIIVFLSLPIQILCTFCILKKTPETMKNVKSSLLKVNLWSIFSGIILGFFVIPLNFFPHLCGVFIGLAANSNPIFQFNLFMTILFGVLISINILFENRSSLIAQNRFAISRTSTRNFWVFINFFGNLALLTPVFLNLPDQETTKLEILKNLPCPAKEFFTESMLIMAYQDFWESYLTVALLFIYFNLMAQILFFSICCIYYLFIFKSSQVSAQTRKLQIQSFVAIIFQSLIPILFDYIPTLIFLDRQRKNDYDQLNNNLMGLSIILHNGMTSLSILLVQKPYRNFLKSIFLSKKKSEELTMQQAAAVPFNPSRPFPVECYANKLNHHVLGAGTNISKEQVKFIEAIAKNIRSSHTYFLEISKNPKSQVQIDELQRRLEEKENENSALKKQVMELTKKLCKMESEKENRISDFGNKDKIRIKARTAKKLDQEKLEKEENEDKKRIEILEGEYAQIRHLKEDASILREYYEPSHFFKRLVKENEQLKTKILEKTTAMDRVMTENQKLKKTNDKALKNIDLLNENIEILKKKKKKKSSYGF
ncbi:Protein CBG21878 [Caenorhabditis briggsae]|uniref:Protein CBG21878 n=2 Tax=Caenorhabditis briggsae TaxID=6238 RepID=A8Y115_CAEBR|nr:Protein CBG21878 [Caenorhabditis briggsae]CAP38584.2 Protein CBG21878 [Caenorhabditis briggsae]